MQEIQAEAGLVGVFTALAAWCDRFAEHARGPDGKPGPLGLDVEDDDPRPYVRWAVELLCARAGWDRPMWAALIEEMPPEWGLHTESVLHWVDHYLQHGQVETPPPIPQAEVEAPLRGLPHGWRHCHLRVRPSPEVDPPVVQRIQAVLDAVWRGLPGSDRRLVHGYLCHQRRDQVSREVFESFRRRLDQAREADPSCPAKPPGRTDLAASGRAADRR
jgi:hypothetical protein